ncbi:MAG: hypothetical protein HKP27_09095 [Myxococcales bacterium]|nr:hypothetical protein [Myxococcales bacterium]
MSRTETRKLRISGPFDLAGTLAPLGTGFGDPTLQVSRSRSPSGAGARVATAALTPEGPASLEVMSEEAGVVVARAWGRGASWMLDRLPDFVGAGDDPLRLTPPKALRDLARAGAGARFPRTHRALEALVVVVLQQKVTGKEAARAFRNLLRRYSEPAPGLPELRLPLAPQTLRELSAAELPPLGVPFRQGELLRELGWRAKRIAAIAELDVAVTKERLLCLRGVGPWSVESLAFRALGDSDAVPVGDFHLPNIVAYNLAGEERADDSRMLELLEPFRGQRGRIIRWLHEAGRVPPRRGPRMPLRPLPTSRAFR